MLPNDVVIYATRVQQGGPDRWVFIVRGGPQLIQRSSLAAAERAAQAIKEQRFSHALVEGLLN